MSWLCCTKENEICREKYFSVSEEVKWLSLNRIENTQVKLAWSFCNFLNFEDDSVELLDVCSCVVI